MNGFSLLSRLRSSLLRLRVGWNWQRLLLVLIASILLIEGFGLLMIWPDWDALREGKVPQSALIRDYLEEHENQPKLPRLRWTPLQKPLPHRVKRAFILAEDSRFYEHHGVDWQAILNAIDYNWKSGKIILGASTISQQTAKNLFLNLSRSPLRKIRELFLTWLLEFKLSKAEILHIYLNVAEFGRGIYGIEAAARHYFHTSAYDLTTLQAAQLAASLPSPRKHNPATQTRFFNKHVSRLARTLQIADQYAAQRGQKAKEEGPLVSAELAKQLQELRELSSDDADTPADKLSDESPETPSAPASEPVVSAGVPSAEPEASGISAGEPAIDKPAADLPTAVPTAAPTPVALPQAQPEPHPQPQPAPRVEEPRPILE